MTEQKTVRELSNVKTVKEIKDILYKKLKDEGCCYKKSDIKYTATAEGFIIQVEDYDNSKFFFNFDYDEIFGYEVWVYCGSDEFPTDELVYYETSHTMIDLQTPLIDIGYYVGTRF